MISVAAMIGLPKSALDTPALLVDLDVMDANITRIAAFCRHHGVGWRPHIKGHKTVEVARKELAAGAVGITCAKLGEAEVMGAAGIANILIANQIVGPIKIRRLMALCDAADPIVAVDSMANVASLAGAAADRQRPLHVVIEVDIGMKRAGVAPGASVVALAKAISEHPSLRFRGLIGWEAHAVTIADTKEKERAVAAAVGLLAASAAACRQAGYALDIVSCGGTGTFPHCAMQPGVTEVQVGGAIFSDMHYRDHYHTDFPCALTLMATVTSRPTGTRIVLDAGKKAMSGDAAMPHPIGLPGVCNLRLSAEHATIELDSPSERPRIGDRVEFIVGYSDTTVHLHEEIVGIRRGCVEAIWPIAARGRLK
jgi:D-serine deaminase-like pyridoxal phosphate-dependent protein